MLRVLVEDIANVWASQIGERDDCARQSHRICARLQPACLFEAVLLSYTDLNMDRLHNRKMGEILAEILYQIVALDRRRVTEEAHDALLHQPGIVAMRKVPKVVVCVDDARWRAHP